MRIGLVSTMRTAVPPPKLGSVEMLVGLLAQELAERGHDVTVFAPSSSTVNTRVIGRFQEGYHNDESIWDWQLAEFMQLGLAYEHAHEFDVIHSHVYCYALPFSCLVETPTVHTFHICPTPDFVRCCRFYPDADYVFLSNFQASFFADVKVGAIIPNGIDVKSFPFRRQVGKYLVFLGDMRADKGPLEAIRWARAAGIPIKLAGPHNKFFEDFVKPQLDSNVEYVGEVDHTNKAALLSGAIALAFPVRSLEACPLVLIESMACGTPIVGLDYGPVPELVISGVTGMLMKEFSDAESTFSAIATMDRSRVRAVAEDLYDYRIMTDRYLEYYEAILERKT